LQPSETLLPSTSGLKPCPGLENRAHFSLFHQSIMKYRSDWCGFEVQEKGKESCSVAPLLPLMFCADRNRVSAERSGKQNHITFADADGSIALRLRREVLPTQSHASLFRALLRVSTVDPSPQSWEPASMTPSASGDNDTSLE
jgi:hypothetical protein